jgi:hypothetical protein
MELLLNASMSGAPSPLFSLPGNVRAVLAPAVNMLIARCRVIQEASGGNIETTIKQLETETLESFDKVLDTITQTLAKDAQKLLTDKLEVSLQGAKRAKQEAAQAGNPWQTDPQAIIDRIVTAPEGSPERTKQQAEALIEILKAYKEPLLAYMELDTERLDNADELKPHASNLMRTLYTPFSALFMDLGVNDPGNWFSPAGRAKFDEAFKKITPEYVIGYFDENNLKNTLAFLAKQDTVPGVNGQPEQKHSRLAKHADEWVKFLTANSSFDFRKSLAEMAAESDDFDKPGMGMFTRNVLST